MSLSAFMLVDAILLIGNHTISEYLLRKGDVTDLCGAEVTMAAKLMSHSRL